MSYKFLIVLFLVQACAHPTLVRTPSSSYESSVPESLLTDLKKITRVITHNTYVYHWAQLSLLDPKNEKNGMELALTRGRTVAQGFWSDDLPDYGLVGNGLYTARDPLMSTIYGSDLTSITLTPGTRLLDIRRVQTKYQNDDYIRGNTIEISDQTVRDLRDSQCTLPNTITLRDHVFKSKECTSIFKEAFRQLKIAGNIHHWWGHNLAVCSGEATAIVIWDEDIFTEKNVRVYRPPFNMQSMHPEAAMEWAYIYALAEASSKQNLMSGFASAILSRGKKSEVEIYHPEVFDSANLHKWANSHSFNCKGAYAEDLVGHLQNLDQQGVEEPITVLSATYGGNLNYRTVDNVLPLLKTCDHKSFCAFPNYPLGVPKSGEPIGDLVVEWSCGQSSERYRTYLKTTPTSPKTMHSISCPAYSKPVARPLGRMKITKAIFGESEVTAKTSAFCDGGADCNYKVSWKLLDVKRSNKRKAFDVEWSCSNRPEQIRTRTIPAPAEGIEFKINCEEDN